MDRTDTKSIKSTSSEQDTPKVPIKTYQWEDVKRSRKRGGYPWTHLDKQPFNEEEDPEDYTMDAFRKSRSRSTSTIGRSESQMRDVSLEPEIEEIVKEKTEQIEEKENVIPSAYLQVPDRGRATSLEETTHTGSTSIEDPKKKRKLSVESSYSRISLSKLSVMDKLRNVKNKMKASKIPRRAKSDVTEEKRPKKFRKGSKQKEELQLRPQPEVAPVYIHIPLKAPSEQTDSNCEPSTSAVTTEASPKKRTFVDLIRQVKEAEENANIQEQNADIDDSTELKPDSGLESSISDMEESFKKCRGAIPKSIYARRKVERTKTNESGCMTIEELTASIEERKSDLEDSQKSRSPEPLVDEPEDENGSLADANQFEQDQQQNTQISEVFESSVEEPVDEVVEITFTHTRVSNVDDVEKISEHEIDVTVETEYEPRVLVDEIQNNDEHVEDSRKSRARSEEPTRKRKSSIDSTFSRKSLSKLAFMKKLKEAKDKIKLPKFPSFSKADKKDKLKKDEDEKKAKAKAEKEEKEQKKAKAKVEKKAKKHSLIPVNKAEQKPVYIYIPLKLPPGETDEFSQFSEENCEEVKPIEKSEDDSKPTTPEVQGKSGVQLIILTPPSDDEILDGCSVPDTPSESGEKFFENVKIGELQNLAKTAVDSVYPSTSKLETVTEDEDSDGHLEVVEGTLKIPLDDKTPGAILIEETANAHESKNPTILFDEEDGLQLPTETTPPAITEPAESPLLKKKVSFKKRTKANNGEEIYEDVVIAEPKLDETISKPEENTTKTLSSEEQTSSIEKNNKWSKLTDHEYEPINPPINQNAGTPPPTVFVTEPASSYANGSMTSLERRLLHTPTDDTTEEMMSSPETQSKADERFVTTPETVSSRTDGELHTSQFDSSAIETLPLQRECRKNIEKTKTITKTEGKGINQTIRIQTNKIKTKLQGIKKPSITFTSSKVKKPSRPATKVPVESRFQLPIFSIFNPARKESAKNSWRKRQYSTESNAGDSKKKLSDFSTFPRIFDRKKKSETVAASVRDDDEADDEEPVEFATVPRTSRKKGPIGSRWANKFKDIQYADEDPRKSKELNDEEHPDAIRIPLHGEDSIETPSHTRYNEDIDIDDDYNRENREIHRASPFSQDYLKRWDHGEFHEGPPSPVEYEQEPRPGPYKITDLDSEEAQTPPESNINSPQLKEASSGSLSEHKRGVLEEIDSDEFFLREKGLSQENIEVGKYLSSEIREAFRNPVNALSQLQADTRGYDMDVSDQSESFQDSVPRKKPIRKPKRRRTPHVSREQLSYDQESEDREDYPQSFEVPRSVGPPARPKRKSKKSRKRKNDVIPFQETIPTAPEDDDDDIPYVDQSLSEISPNNILGAEQPPQVYENGQMAGIEQPQIHVNDNYNKYEHFQKDIDDYLEKKQFDEPPPIPNRKHKSARSLNNSEPDSILEEISKYKDIPNQEFAAYRVQEYMIPTPEPPPRPQRTRYRTRSPSATTSQLEDDRTSRGAESLVSDNQVPCIEEPCVQEMRDYMGYAVIDKNRMREPPLPPPRFPPTPPRARRTLAPDKFSTTPRATGAEVPVRPLRNYSTLGPNRPARNRSTSYIDDAEEEKENCNGDYSDIVDGEQVRRLQSGDVVRKMRARPLPAPPRPPRRTRGADPESALRDITHASNNTTPELDEKSHTVVESTRTEQPAIHGNYVKDSAFSEEQQSAPNRDLHDIEATLQEQIIPYTHQETITHGSLVVQPLDVKFVSHSLLNKRSNPQTPPVEHIIPIHRESENDIDDETSEIPEEFHKLQDPPPPPQVPQNAQKPVQEVAVLRADKVQASDMDVNKLKVNELQASKIIVSELEGVSIQVAEINSKSGNLVVSGIELAPNVLQEVLEKIQSQALPSVPPAKPPNDPHQSEEDDVEQKKTPIKQLVLETCSGGDPPTARVADPPDERISTQPMEASVETVRPPSPPPIRPPRRSIEDVSEDNGDVKTESTPESPLDSEIPSYPAEDDPSSLVPPSEEEAPPPRPPRPSEGDYIRSQPPPSFYALRSPTVLDCEDNIPLPPRRKRPPRAVPTPLSTSSSDGEHPRRRRQPRSPESSIPQLSAQLVRACTSETERVIRGLIANFRRNVLHNEDNKQDTHVMMLILLVLIAGLILLGGDQRVTVHHHQWEFYNPPTDL